MINIKIKYNYNILRQKLFFRESPLNLHLISIKQKFSQKIEKLGRVFERHGHEFQNKH